MASAADAEPWYVSLLGLAETFRTSNPPNIRLCIHCLQSIFNFKPPPRIESRTHLQLGNILLAHTKNIDLAQTHLEKAWTLSCSMAAADDVRFEAASVLAQIYEKQQQVDRAKPILKKAIEVSQQAPYWHCRLLFHLAQIHASERDYVSACQLLGVGSEFALSAKSDYLRLLFLLSKGMLLLVDKKMPEVKEVLSMAGALIERYQGSPTQKESLNVFFLVLQVCHYLMAGQVKSVKPCLKQLQQSIQTVTQLHSDDEPLSSNQIDQFQWLPKEHMCVLVYLVTVMHSMQAGYMDKAQKYTDKALMQIEKLKMLDAHPLLSSFQLMLLEHIVMCRLIMGSKSAAIQEIFQACNVCQQQPRLFSTHGAQIHTLLGLYAMSMNCMEAAESQFNTAFKLSTDVDLRTFVKLNLAIVYLRTNRQTDLISLLETVVSPQKVSPSTDRRLSTDSEVMSRIGSHSLRASAFYVRGLQAFFQAGYNEAKRYLRETLKMANAEDLNRLTSCSLVLLGHIFLSLGNSREAMNMVTPAMQLAGKIPDVHVQLWASSLLKDLYRLCGDQVKEAEGYRMHTSFSQDLLKDHFQSSQLSEHGLIQWTEGPCPFHLSSEVSSSIL
ncbi:MAU2 chromatid cohesion factor homolog [Octopus bimaculoides]|uniref:MAU2 chromatid cohesion factor homolog n=1 Tax=Octopus bimaculoides TaxID=37653 RepID=A0A0L8GX50_OCTBM|nr:MAU2 chromatid cohesion factor homolog [Octopus bimaculoides]|eukprot:XP_014777387.1 PREDICTED: MAU2 chromatid cohesion factor homolog [Octopus bimaculoides]